MVQVMTENNVVCFEPGIARREGEESRFVDGKSVTLRARMGDNQPAVCYRKTTHPHNREEGQGYEEATVADTLNAYDIGENRTPVIVLEGNGSRPSHLGKGFSEDGKMYTLNTIETHSVCYGISRSMLKGGMNAGGMPVGENLQPAITANGCGAVCYGEKK